MKPILVTSGEPAGIGPDLCLALAFIDCPVVILGDKQVLTHRAQKLQLQVDLIDYYPNMPLIYKSGELKVLSLPCATTVEPGLLNVKNSHYVIEMLTLGANKVLKGEFSALVTAPIHKAIINEAGINFTGHTEFLAKLCSVDDVVMMLACDIMRVALVTTHMPLKSVPGAITAARITTVIKQVYKSLQQMFGIKNPCIYVAGLNPHAGEDGYLGHEEIDIISPALLALKAEGIELQGPLPADTLFIPENIKRCDVFVAMYHDQGLPVLKYAGFGNAVNITLGLPLIRTSVDHGTALSLAGSGQANAKSLIAAVNMALCMAKNMHPTVYND